MAMKFKRGSECGFSALFVGLVMATSGTHAATLDIDGSGQLLGAFDVNVDGSLYDVEFRNGSCEELYEGCDSVSDFPFGVEPEGDLAAHALLDQVLIDSVSLGLFDSDPSLTRGCGSGTDTCHVLTPFDFRDPSGLSHWNVSNRVNEVNDLVYSLSLSATEPETVLGDGLTYAVWTFVPEPGSGLLQLTALLVVAGLSRCRGRTGLVGFTQAD
jgi:hypothetical protein